MTLVDSLTLSIQDAVKAKFSIDLEKDLITITPTKPDFEGNYTVVVFQLLRAMNGNPASIGQEIGNYLKSHSPLVSDFNVVKGFLNLTISESYWISFLHSINDQFWSFPKTNKEIVLEYCGPNTNKPLHLGHVRNMLVGWSVAEILTQAGHTVHKVNIYNDRGIAICKSMVAWTLYGNGDTPKEVGVKGDHFVGSYYVKYAQIEKEQAEKYLNKGFDQREAVKQTDINKKARECLLKWENNDPATRKLWKKMNNWVYDGFSETFEAIGVDFEKDYLESETYQLGRKIVLNGLEQGHFYEKEDQSVWVNLEDVGLDEKLLLRGDGTSVYITQDLGTAQLRYEDFKMDDSIYVVGNEQDYHFKVLKATLKKLGKPYAEGIKHLSYGMVDLPSGKMKSREGTVVDADDLVAEMISTAKETTEELGKVDHFTEKQKEELYHTVGLGALKFFILRVDPKKQMLFDPKESIDFQGFTGPFVQYTYARIQSLLDKVGFSKSDLVAPPDLTEHEIDIIKLIHHYPDTLQTAADTLDPSHIAKYAYDVAKTFNKFYAHVPVNNEEDESKKMFRLHLVKITGITIQKSLQLLGIQSPDRM